MGELLSILPWIAIGAALLLGTYAFILIAVASGPIEPMYDKPHGDIPHLHVEAKAPARVTRGGVASVGASGGTRTEAIARSHGGAQ